MIDVRNRSRTAFAMQMIEPFRIFRHLHQPNSPVQWPNIVMNFINSLMLSAFDLIVCDWHAFDYVY